MLAPPAQLALPGPLRQLPAQLALLALPVLLDLPRLLLALLAPPVQPEPPRQLPGRLAQLALQVQLPLLLDLLALPV